MKFSLISFSFLLLANFSANASNQLLPKSMCGFSDEIHSYLKTHATTKITSNIMVSGKQGETSRLIRIYESGDWFVSFEFFSSGPVETDVSCIIASGKRDDNRAYELVSAIIHALPKSKYKEFGKNPKDYEPLKNFKPSN